MKKSISLIAFPFFFFLFFFGCQDAENILPPPAEFSCENSPKSCELTAANGHFAIDIFKNIHGNSPDDNIFISPFSISTALTMTTNGADGETLEQMRNALRINNLEINDVNGSYQELLEVLPNLDPQTKLKLANSLWPQEGAPVLPSFLDLSTNYFNSEVNTLDFRNPDAVNIVNEWVSDNTDGLIENALAELSPEVAMLLINAIYFNGTWKSQFDPADTHQAPFYLAENDSASVDMMHIKEGTFPYFSNEIFHAVDMAYGDSIYSMSVFLPHPGHTTDEIMEAMNAESWETWLSSFRNQNVEIFFPKFEMEYEIKLRGILSEMGMDRAFTSSADFSKMFEGGNVNISEVIHKAFVEVNEEGTEAAAVTVVVILNSASTNMLFNANQPFVFVIRDNKTNSILFMGKMMNPVK